MNMVEYLLMFLSMLGDFREPEYLTDENAFTKNGKCGFKETLRLILAHNKKTGLIEADIHMLEILGGFKNHITNSGFSDRRLKIKGTIFQKINFKYIKGFYKKFNKQMWKYKGYYVFAIDTSIMDIPNTPEICKIYNVERRDKKGAKKKKIGNDKTPTARCSTMVDAINGFIMDSIFASRDVKETDLAIQHIRKIKDVLNGDKAIVMYDRGYNLIELIVTHQMLDIPFIIRGKSNTFKKFQKKLKKIDDRTFEYSLTSAQIEKFANKDVKDYAEKINKSFKIRIVKVMLPNGDIEILFTNLTKEEASPNNLRALYFKRWTVEKNFDRLKNLLKIEKISGRKKESIEQDIYSHVLFFNMCLTIQKCAYRQMNYTPRENNKYRYHVQPNFNYIVGLMKLLFPVIFTSSNDVKKEILDYIVYISSKRLSYTKIKSSPNYERETFTNHDSECKTSIKVSF